MKTCPSCQATEIMTDLSIVDHGYLDSKHELAVELHENPGAWVYKGTKRGVLKASICARCGHVALSIDDPGELWRLYRAARRG